MRETEIEKKRKETSEGGRRKSAEHCLKLRQEMSGYTMRANRQLWMSNIRMGVHIAVAQTRVAHTEKETMC